MKNKTVIFTGAGFSAPAKLPIQRDIFKEIVAKPTSSIMDTNALYDVSASVKFLSAYIEVGLYLLSQHFGDNISLIINEYKRIKGL